ncbi:MAG: hypothetical protein AAGN82_06630 [Myxococcota bacterium]
MQTGMELTAETLFRRYFLPLYPPEARTNLDTVRATDANPAGNPRILGQLDAIAATFTTVAPRALDAEDLVLDYSDASIHRLAAAVDRKRRDAMLSPGLETTGGPANDGSAAGGPPAVPPLVHLVTHGAVYTGACIVRNHEGRWQVRSPLWESRVELTSRAGTGDLAIFQWWLKSLSDDEIDEPRLADRYRLLVEVPRANPDALPVIATPGRKLPRLKKVDYSLLHKYLKARLPELRGVGEHFPTPEGFTKLGFKWLDFMLVGGGRMLLMHGPTPQGVHLFWLDASGFSHSAFYPADSFPAHIVKDEGERLVVHVPILGAPQTHEMLWSGPTP